MIKASEINKILEDDYLSKKSKILNDIESKIKQNMKEHKIVIQFTNDKKFYEEIVEDLIKDEYDATIREDWGYDGNGTWWINFYELIITW